MPAPTGESRGIGFTIRTMKVFDQRGLLPRFGEIQTSEAGHFGGLPLDLGVLGSAHGAARTVPQSMTEAVLEGWARELGADIRRGQEFTGVTEDADGAKPTLYSYFSDKATLFREALQAVARSTLHEKLAALEPLGQPGEDLRTTLEDVGHGLVRIHSGDRSWALRRLLWSEVTRLPDLIDIIKESGPQRVDQALAGALARLMVAGRLRSTEPGRAAEHFIALLTGPLEARSLMGTRRIDDAEARDVARAAVQIFLQALNPPLSEDRAHQGH